MRALSIDSSLLTLIINIKYFLLSECGANIDIFIKNCNNLKNKKTYKLEACVDGLSSALNAHKQGADQLELCSRLDLDGLSPSPELVKSIIENIPIHTKVMLRTHNNGFSCTTSDIEIIRKEIDALQELGVKEVVFGAIEKDRLDISLIDKVCTWANPMKLTVHKAIDTSCDIIADCKRLSDIKGIRSILSSGGQSTAMEGIDMLIKMKEACGDKISLIPAGRITSSNVESIHGILDCTVYHGKLIVGALD